MLNSTQPKNDKCCCCLSMKFGVGLQWSFDLCLCVLALTLMFNNVDGIKSELEKGINDPECQRVVQWILFSIVSVVSVISGSIGVFGNFKFAQKVFNISSIIESAQGIFCSIWLVIMATLGNDPDLDSNARN
eukprot:488314_1